MSRSKPENPVAEKGSSRVIRGGDWYDIPDTLLSSIRDRPGTPSRRYNDSGFRLARTAKK